MEVNFYQQFEIKSPREKALQILKKFESNVINSGVNYWIILG
jgi:hypothetical protein